MRLFLSVISATLLATATPAIAAENGTYRPGQAYMSIPAQNPAQCEQQCQGDAQCKGWNFVRIRANAKAAICEFNARKAAPVASPISISGDNHSATASARLVQTGQRTTRVGEPSVMMQAMPTRTTRIGAVPQPAQEQRSRQVHAQRPQQRVVRRAPIPQHIQPQTAAYRTVRPAPAQPATRAPQFRHSLDSSAPRMAARPQQLPAQRPAIAPSPRNNTFRPQLDTLPQQKATKPAAPAPVQPVREASVNAPIATAPTALPAGQNFHTGPKVNKSLSQLKVTPPAQRRADSRLAGGYTPPVSVETAQSSLFGSLYDDVKAPKSLTPQDIPANPDAPIPTVTSVPTQKIEQSPM